MTKPLQQLTKEEAIAELAALRERLKGNEHLAPQQLRVLAQKIQRSRIQLRLSILATVASLAVFAAATVAIFRGSLTFLWALIPAAIFTIVFGYTWFSLTNSNASNRRSYDEWKAALHRTRARSRHDTTMELNVYRARATDVIDELRGKATRNRRLHNILQVTVIVGSIVVTSLASIGANVEAARWANICVAALVSISAGLSGLFKFRDRSYNEQRTADSIEKEGNHLDLGIGPYAIERPEALKVFAAKVESLREEQRKAELQLDQNPDSENRSSSTSES